MMFKVVEEGRQVILETERGRFVFSESLKTDSPGVFIGYQEPGKPIRTLADIEHVMESDCLQLRAWQHSNLVTGDLTHQIIFERPEAEDLTHLTEVIQQVKQTHAGCELVFIKKAAISPLTPYHYILGYFDRDYNLYPLHELTFDSELDDIKYCVESHGIEWREE